MANIELTNSVLIQKIAHQEIANGCDPDHIDVGGYNEGLDVALLAALCIDQRIRGILAITDDLGRKDGIPEWRKPANAKTPLFVVDYSGKNNNASEKLFASIEQPVGAFVHGMQYTALEARLLSSEDPKSLDAFIYKSLAVEIALNNQHIFKN